MTPQERIEELERKVGLLHEMIEGLENREANQSVNTLRTEIAVTCMKLILDKEIPRFSEFVDQMVNDAMGRMADKLEKS